GIRKSRCRLQFGQVDGGAEFGWSGQLCMGSRAAIGRMRAVSRALALSLLLPCAVAAQNPAAQDPSPAANDRVQLASPAVHLADFSLTDQDNRPLRFSDLNEHTKLVFFGFTHCQSVCPPTLQKLRQVCRSLASEDAT